MSRRNALFHERGESGENEGIYARSRKVYELKSMLQEPSTLGRCHVAARPGMCGLLRGPGREISPEGRNQTPPGLCWAFSVPPGFPFLLGQWSDPETSQKDPQTYYGSALIIPSQTTVGLQAGAPGGRSELQLGRSKVTQELCTHLVHICISAWEGPT